MATIPASVRTAVTALPRPGPRPVSLTRKRVALAIAALSDVVQVCFFPLFIEGAISPFDIVLDAVTAVAILVAVGFQWRLALALALELTPGVDMFPTWTAVVASLPAVADPEPVRTPAGTSRPRRSAPVAR